MELHSHLRESRSLFDSFGSWFILTVGRKGLKIDNLERSMIDSLKVTLQLGRLKISMWVTSHIYCWLSSFWGSGISIEDNRMLSKSWKTHFTLGEREIKNSEVTASTARWSAVCVPGALRWRSDRERPARFFASAQMEQAQQCLPTSFWNPPAREVMEQFHSFAMGCCRLGNFYLSVHTLSLSEASCEKKEQTVLKHSSFHSWFDTLPLYLSYFH